MAELHEAVLAEDVGRVKKLLSGGLFRKPVDVMARHGNRRTALHDAAETGNLAVLRLLLAAGADPNARDGDGCIPLHNAAEHGHAEVARTLLEKGAEVDALCGYNLTPLLYAADFSRTEVVRVLTERGGQRQRARGRRTHATALGGHPGGSGDGADPAGARRRGQRHRRLRAYASSGGPTRGTYPVGGAAPESWRAPVGGAPSLYPGKSGVRATTAPALTVRKRRAVAVRGIAYAMRPSFPRGHGFTLLEVLVVLAIIAILAAILFPVLGAARASGQKVACVSNVRQLLQASSMYASDHNRRLVAARIYTGGVSLGTTWCVALQPYLKNEQILTCPLDIAPQTVANSTDLPHSYGINYDLTYMTGYGVTNLSWAMSALPRTTDLVLFFDLKSSALAMGSGYTAHRVSRVDDRHQGKAIIGFLDGHAKPQAPKEIDAARFWNPTAP